MRFSQWGEGGAAPPEGGGGAPGTRYACHMPNPNSADSYAQCELTYRSIWYSLFPICCCRAVGDHGDGADERREEAESIKRKAREFDMDMRYGPCLGLTRASPSDAPPCWALLHRQVKNCTHASLHRPREQSTSVTLNPDGSSDTSSLLQGRSAKSIRRRPRMRLDARSAIPAEMRLRSRSKGGRYCKVMELNVSRTNLQSWKLSMGGA
ncbi:hypothetical protein ZWY2020_034234 [Hordeum vulgare]|nr:hypothetical protein ZWY2020_034234 [Hordeum vulgare]